MFKIGKTTYKPLNSKAIKGGILETMEFENLDKFHSFCTEHQILMIKIYYNKITVFYMNRIVQFVPDILIA